MAPTAATKKRLRVGAKATVLVSRLHPKDKVTQAYPNSTKDERSVEIVTEICPIQRVGHFKAPC